MSRDFDLGDILSITTGALVSPRHIDGVYDILDYMTGDQLFTHQLPRAATTCQGPLLAQHPQLADVQLCEFTGSNEDRKRQVDAWLQAQKVIYGEALPVSPLDDWHHMNPLQELAELTETPDRIVVVEVPS